MKLAVYHKKRNFKKTTEPKGKIAKKNKHLYVIQKHAASHLHYDFRLELHGVLLSWAIPKGPCFDPSVKRLAIHVEDHPVEYGNFEGIIPEGEYGAGTVMLWDQGIWIPEDDPEKAYEKGHLRFQLKAKKLEGGWNLIRFKKNDDKSWFLIKSKDEYARPLTEFDVTKEEPNSVLSNDSLDEITSQYTNVWTKNGLKKASKKKPHLPPKIKIDLPTKVFPKFIFPELATLVDKPPEGHEWLHEIKFDGYRILVFKHGKNIKLMSRNNKDWSNYFGNVIHEIKKAFAKNIILDGEIVILNEHQQSDFQLLQNAIGSNEPQPFIYNIFDLLYYDKFNLMSLPLIERKNVLHQLLLNANNPTLLYSDHITGKGSDVFKNACEMGLEGIVSKKMDSIYEERRTKSWLKSKCKHRQEFVIGGFSQAKGSRNFFGSLYLGYYDKKGKLQFCGNVGTGFDHASLKKIYDQLKKLIIKSNPFATKPPGVTSATWVKPKLVAEVEFSEWTKEGILRQPSFKGLRTDKPAKTIMREESNVIDPTSSSKKPKVISEEIPFKLTNPDKVLYSEDGITKYDIAFYYDQIQEWILPYIVNRPLTLLRCPESYKECFYQKHIDKGLPNALRSIPIEERHKLEKYIYINDSKGLMALPQMGCLEIHPWGSRIENLECPDLIIFDLDPGPDVTWKQIVTAAKRIKKHLAEFELKSFVKTTGGNGLHVVFPIKPEYDWDTIKQFSKIFVQFIVENYPDDYVMQMTKSERKGKIYVDYLRNQRGATAIAPYSTRARNGAPVATPLDWDELTNKKEDTFYTIETLPKRLNKLKKDPWYDFFRIKQKLGLDKL